MLCCVFISVARFAKYSQNWGSAVLIYKKHLKRLIYLDCFLENETMEMFSMEESSKTRRKFGGTKVCESERVREYFVNPKIENKVSDYL